MMVDCHILRGKLGEKPRWHRYLIDVTEGSTVLEVLHMIRQLDPGLAYTVHHCKMGVCGGCMMVINGRKRLACRTLVNQSELRIEPVPGLLVIKDLLVDLFAMHQKYLLQRKENS